MIRTFRSYFYSAKISRLLCKCVNANVQMCQCKCANVSMQNLYKFLTVNFLQNDVKISLGYNLFLNCSFYLCCHNKNWAIPTSFSFLFSFNTLYLTELIVKKWLWLYLNWDHWSWKQQPYQLRHKHCPYKLSSIKHSPFQCDQMMELKVALIFPLLSKSSQTISNMKVVLFKIAQKFTRIFGQLL